MVGHQSQDQFRMGGQGIGTYGDTASGQAALTRPGEEATADRGNPEGNAGEGRSLDEILEVIERREILNALQRANGQRTQAAQFLRISRSRLYRRMEALGIDPRTGEPGPGV